MARKAHHVSGDLNATTTLNGQRFPHACQQPPKASEQHVRLQRMDYWRGTGLELKFHIHGLSIKSLNQKDNVAVLWTEESLTNAVFAIDLWPQPQKIWGSSTAIHTKNPNKYRSWQALQSGNCEQSFWHTDPTYRDRDGDVSGISAFTNTFILKWIIWKRHCYPVPKYMYPSFLAVGILRSPASLSVTCSFRLLLACQHNTCMDLGKRNTLNSGGIWTGRPGECSPKINLLV